jgi:ABC-type uncharacterized transport system substrate-binding protein
MSRSLITEANPQVIAQDATVEEVDIDHIAVNIPVNHDAMENVVKSFTATLCNLPPKKEEIGIARAGIF